MYTLENFKEDTISNVGGISAADTSLTLTSGNFTNTTDGILVLDYDVAAKREIITCTITGTAITSITRAQGGTSAVAHAQNAKVLLAMTSLHYGGGLGKLASEDAWTAWVPTFTGFSVAPVVVHARYIQIGKLVFFSIDMGEGTSNATGFTITLPVAAKNEDQVICVSVRDNGAAAPETGLISTRAASTTADVFANNTKGSWTALNGKSFIGSGVYEAN